ncbi:hypothetical protein B0J12DRAFT_313820 [Macrophomina phaseolina]|uniref:Uncharacterized protein n=1 Tax=Macrophomina phaseolina TaxID=35725 RepID=A0ABQ8FWG8_9PEZI|nr:hypothetical protein B0J12DRAFT_313820 [Macrophomina phaseolina]
MMRCEPRSRRPVPLTFLARASRTPREHVSRTTAPRSHHPPTSSPVSPSHATRHTDAGAFSFCRVNNPQSERQGAPPDPFPRLFIVVALRRCPSTAFLIEPHSVCRSVGRSFTSLAFPHLPGGRPSRFSGRRDGFVFSLAVPATSTALGRLVAGLSPNLSPFLEREAVLLGFFCLAFDCLGKERGAICLQGCGKVVGLRSTAPFAFLPRARASWLLGRLLG